jgi:hypothetical protein
MSMYNSFGYGDRWWDTGGDNPVATSQQLIIPWVTAENPYNPLSGIANTTSITLKFGPPVGVTTGSYGGAVVSSGTYSDPDFVINTTTATYTLTNLTPGQKYSFRVRAYSGANATGNYGSYAYGSFTMPKAANVSSVGSTVSKTTSPFGYRWWEKDSMESLENSAEVTGSAFGTSSAPVVQGSSTAYSTNRTIQRSFLQVDSTNPKSDSYSVAIKNTEIDTSYKRFSFGAGILFSNPKLLTGKNAGGIGFFTNNTGTNGYYIELQTDQSHSNNEDKSCKIYKIVDTQRVYLLDSQDEKDKDGKIVPKAGKMLGGVLKSTLYKLDVEVTIEPTVTTIDVYVNNFRITAVDATIPNTTDPKKKVIEPTPYIALFSRLHTTAFDYVYATPVSDTKVIDSKSRSLYAGQYSEATIEFAFGEKVSEDFYSPTDKAMFLEEFGKTVREIRHVKANFAQSAAIPIYASTGINKFATILGSKFSNHSAEIFVMNNASSFIPLSVGNEQQFFVLGNYVDNGSQHEYTEEANESIAVEPALFSSMWIQSEADAKALYGWIKTQWSKQQQSVNMEIFGNPSIEVGDVISITYPKNDLDGTKKFLVTNVEISFEEGISTSITARSIYSS